MKKKKQRLSDTAICDAISQAIRLPGWSIPTDEASVTAAEKLLAENTAELPDRLKQPKLTTMSGGAFANTVAPLWDSSSFVEPMARAARDGGTVPSDIEDIMKQDRKAAEHELQNRMKKKRNDG